MACKTVVAVGFSCVTVLFLVQFDQIVEKVAKTAHFMIFPRSFAVLAGFAGQSMSTTGSSIDKKSTGAGRIRFRYAKTLGSAVVFPVLPRQGGLRPPGLCSFSLYPSRTWVRAPCPSRGPSGCRVRIALSNTACSSWRACGASFSSSSCTGSAVCTGRTLPGRRSRPWISTGARGRSMPRGPGT